MACMAQKAISYPYRSSQNHARFTEMPPRST